MNPAVYEKARGWMTRCARPIDLARFRLLFEGGSREEVLRCLAAYQNADGGFGHALEADSWNPNSCPIQTWCATEILLEAGHEDPGHPIVRGILRYLRSGADYRERRWLAEVPSNNGWPHAPWWTYGEDAVQEWGMNPTACLAGFLLRYAEPGDPLLLLAEDLAREAARLLLGGAKFNGMEEASCFVRLYQYARDAGRGDLFVLDAYRSALEDVAAGLITQDVGQWSVAYCCRPSQFVLSRRDFLYPALREWAELEAEVIEREQREDGSWGIPWRWAGYPDEFAVSSVWWQAHRAILNLQYLRGFST